MELIDGTWHYDGRPIRIKLIGRVEDERRDIADLVRAELVADVEHLVRAHENEAIRIDVIGAPVAEALLEGRGDVAAANLKITASRRALVDFSDVLPTLATLCGATVPEGADGLTFLPALLGEGEQPRHDFLYWEFGNQLAVRCDD